MPGIFRKKKNQKCSKKAGVKYSNQSKALQWHIAAEAPCLMLCMVSTALEVLTVQVAISLFALLL
jgi:hypothetical protein